MRLLFFFAGICAVAACGSSGSTTGGSSGDGGASSGGIGSGASSSSSGGEGSGGADGGGDASADAPPSGCACDPATQYCLHGDTTTSGQKDVYRCEARTGNCADCTCYSQLGLCLEQGTPRSCAMSGGVITVECSEIP